MSEPKFLVFEGVDEVGKSTFINKIKSLFNLNGHMRELKFPKVLPSGNLLRINDEKSFEILFTMFDNLNPNHIYVFDRFVTSNLVYDKVLRGEDVSLSAQYRNKFFDYFDALEIIFTRPEIKTDFVDDKISMPCETFNQCIREYQLYGPNHMLLKRDVFGNVVEEDQVLVADLVVQIANFIDG